MSYLPYILTPLFGAIIGYITNWIAIKMLFRPHRAHYLLGKKLPFTPGIIPKEKGRIAASIVEAISQNLMNEEVLRHTLLRDEMLSKVGTAFDKGVFKTIENHLPAMLASLDIKCIIEDRINGMDTMEVERLIFEVMDKELTAIIRLGILLGFIMGCLNCLFL